MGAENEILYNLIYCMGACSYYYGVYSKLFGDDMKESKYLLLFNEIMAERSLNVGQTVELIAVALGVSPNTVRGYKNKRCPAVYLKFLEMHFHTGK